jgi:hypothetical protein
MTINNFVSGDRFQILFSFPDYPPNLYTLSVAIRGAGSLDLEAVTSNDDYLLTITKTQSRLLAAGDYSYQARITEDADEENVITVETGSFKVLPNLAAISGDYDARSDKQKQLDLVEDAIAQLTGNNSKQYKIKDREFTYLDLTELRAWRNQLRTEISRETRSSSGMRSYQVIF